MTALRERYFSAEWEWACCGGPLHVGDLAELRVQEDSEYARSVRAELAAAMPEPLTGVETHHDDDGDVRIEVREGRVVALHAVIEDLRWTVRPRVTPEPVARSLGDGWSAVAGNTAPVQASGERVKSTSRIVPLSVVPDVEAIPPDADPDLTVFGEQIRPHLAGYLITISGSPRSAS